MHQKWQALPVPKGSVQTTMGMVTMTVQRALPPGQSIPWDDDGDIIVKAGTLRFKVFKSMLIMNSAVWRTMFRLPQPESSSAVAELELHDPEYDVRDVLLALKDRS